MSEPDGPLPLGTSRWVEALTWHETLTEVGEAQLTSTVIRDWQIWYADPENQRLFDRLSELTADGRLVRRTGRWRTADIPVDPYDLSVPIALWRRTSSRRAAQRHRPFSKTWRPWVMGVGAVTAMAAMAAVVAWLPWAWFGAGRLAAPVTLQTHVAGLQDIHLTDGSTITLGGRTKLSVSFSSRARSVDLMQGEAWFRVAHDPKWPFVVQAGGGTIRAVGTAFLVTRDSDRVVVTVTEGTVAVAAPSRTSFLPSHIREAGAFQPHVPIRVSDGEEVSYRDDGTVASVANADTHAATAWTHGRLIFNDEPLRYVIEGVNRYFPRPISATSSAGRLRFSGVIFDGEIDDWLHGLSAIFPVVVDERGAGICIRMSTDRSCPSIHAPQ